jgi:hypothetical protein
LSGSPSYESIKDVVLFIVAVYAAVLSTINFLRAIRKERRSIRVLATTAMPTYGPHLGPPFAQITAVNDGHRVACISLLTFELPNKSRLFALQGTGIPGLESTRLPAKLEQGETAQFFISYADIGHALLSHGLTTRTKLTPVCEDTTGGRYRGKPWTVDPKEYVSMGQR